MSKNNTPSPSSRPRQGKDRHRPRLFIGGYQPKATQASPQKPPSNPPKIGKSSGKK